MVFNSQVNETNLYSKCTNGKEKKKTFSENNTEGNQNTGSI